MDKDDHVTVECPHCGQQCEVTMGADEVEGVATCVAPSDPVLLARWQRQHPAQELVLA